jgi:PAS domain S-box-containing protein
MTEIPLATLTQPEIDQKQSTYPPHLSHHQLTIMLNGIVDGVTAQDPTGQLIYANDAAAQLTGYPDAAALLKSSRAERLSRIEMFDESRQPLNVEELPSRLALHGLESPPKVMRFRMRGSSDEHWSLVKAHAVLDPAGQIEMVVNIFHDITELKHTEIHQSVLAQAATLFSAPLNYETRINNLAQVAVTHIADWCAVDEVNPDGSVRRLAMAHVNPDKIKLALEMERRFPTPADQESGVRTVLRTGQSALYPSITDEMLEAAIKDPEQLALAKQLELKSIMIVPMIARGRTLGALSLAWAESGRHYTPIDLSLAEELARRAALSMDNALLYDESQRSNVELEARVAERTVEVRAANEELSLKIMQHRQAEEQVRRLNAELEQRVSQRTTDLETANHALQTEIAERQQASKALRSLLKRTRELYHISQTIGAVRTPDEILQALLSSSYFKTASRAAIAIFDTPWSKDNRSPSHCAILVEWNKDADAPVFLGQQLTLEEMGLIPPYSRDKPIIIEDVRSMELSERARRRFEALKTRCLILLPLIAGDRWYGLMTLHFKARRAIGLDDLRHLRGLVDETAIAIDNLRLLQAEANARHEAEQANDVKMKFLAMISHELRTPLTSIKGFATTLLAEDVQWEATSQRDFLQTINEEADKLSDLIEQLLETSRLEAGTLRIEPKIQALAKIIATAMAQLQMVTAQHQLILAVPPDLPPVIVDAQRIAQVLTNLVGNAVKYSPKKTSITISAQLMDNMIQIDVADQGPGISPRDRARVFEPFQQLKHKAVHQMEGVGLGLAICKGLVEAHQGRIWIQDRSGPGTIISFTLPISAAA